MDKEIYQCRLTQDDATLITWLTNEKPFKVGNFLTLKGETGRWKVASKGRAHKLTDIKRGWDFDLKRR